VQEQQKDGLIPDSAAVVVGEWVGQAEAQVEGVVAVDVEDVGDVGDVEEGGD
jgi:hypothetical protein